MLRYVLKSLKRSIWGNKTTRTYQVDVLVRLQDAPPLPLRLLAPVVVSAVLSEQARVMMVTVGRLLTEVGLLDQDEPLGALVVEAPARLRDFTLC